MADDEKGAPCMVSTLGMFIIDQFQFEDEVTGENLGDKGVGHHIGGGGTYFAIGARMWLPPSSILMTVDRGNDFSSKEQEMMDTFAHSNSSAVEGSHSLWRYRDRPEGTTRAVNIYRGEERGFAYLTPKLRLDPKDLISKSHSTFPLFIHCICSPQRAHDICTQIDERQDLWYRGKRPKIVWEPIPDSAIPDNLQECLRVMAEIDVISPNHEEAASFLPISKSLISGENARHYIETLLLGEFISKAKISCASKGSKIPIICIRSGALGAVIAQSQGEAVWVEAYHTTEETHRVVDVTGAGNAWLGGFTAGLAKLNRDQEQGWTINQLKEAAQMASVSASFVVEQQSLPTLHHHQIEEGVEKWNNEEPASRLKILQDRGKIHL